MRCLFLYVPRKKSRNQSVTISVLFFSLLFFVASSVKKEDKKEEEATVAREIEKYKGAHEPTPISCLPLLLLSLSSNKIKQKGEMSTRSTCQDEEKKNIFAGGDDENRALLFFSL